MVAQSSPTPVHLTFSGGSGTSSFSITEQAKLSDSIFQHWITTSKPSLTNDLHKQQSLVLSSWVGNTDAVVALIFSLCPLDDKAAEVFPGLHSYAPFCV